MITFIAVHRDQSPFTLHVTRAPWSVFQDGTSSLAYTRRAIHAPKAGCAPSLGGGGSPLTGFRSPPQPGTQPLRRFLPCSWPGCRAWRRGINRTRAETHRHLAYRPQQAARWPLLDPPPGRTARGPGPCKQGSGYPQDRTWLPGGILQDGRRAKETASPCATWRSLSPPAGVLCTVPSWYFCAIRLTCWDLALEGSYPPYSACTLKQAYSEATGVVWTDLLAGYRPVTFCGVGVPPTSPASEPTRPGACTPHCTGTFTAPGFRAGLRRVHSQLLAPSQLISCTPLIYMLKFRGLSGAVQSWLKRNVGVQAHSRPLAEASGWEGMRCLGPALERGRCRDFGGGCHTTRTERLSLGRR